MRIATDVKEPVRIFGMRPELVLGLQSMDDVFRESGEELVITSVIDGKHSRASLHYVGQAADIRTRNINREKLEGLVLKCRINLGPDFDLIIESNHLHLEFQPKNRY